MITLFLYYNKMGGYMNLYLLSVFIFFLGSVVGWILELVYRRILHGKLVNPGFLVGPYLPIYGFGLTIMTLLGIYLKTLTGKREDGK